jgi:hypothetical protein
VTKIGPAARRHEGRIYGRLSTLPDKAEPLLCSRLVAVLCVGSAAHAPTSNQKFFERGLILAMSDALTHRSAYFDAGATR